MKLLGRGSLALAATFLLTAAGCALPDAAAAQAAATCNQTLPPTGPVTPAIARGGLPCRMAFDGAHVKADLANLQLAFDFNSWLSFVALSEPAGGGAPAWAAWQDLSNLMLPGGAAPPAFGTGLPPPAICAGAGPGTPVLRMISKTVVTPTVSVAGEPLNTGPLIDQNGNYVRYQILVNQPMYDYIVGNKFYSKAVQKNFTGAFNFPAGTAPKGTTPGAVGAMVLKVAWKVLAANDDPTRFKTMKGFVYTPAGAGVSASCTPKMLGLVGLHIVHKMDNAPQWSWGTFEHMANVPNQPATTGQFNFYDPKCGSACPANKQAPKPWDPSAVPFPNGFHSQIIRTTRYPKEAVDSAGRWNAEFRAALTGSALTNYMLVTTQWPTNPTQDPTDPNGSPFPLFAANTTMETYVQGNVPQGSSSCMGCHGNATSASGTPSDFSFVLEKAQ